MTEPDDGTDPSRRAVALGYDQVKRTAPKVLATGKGSLADRIIELARENQIPVREDRDLVQLLSKLDVGEAIPAELYPVVAEVFAFVYRLNAQQAAAGYGTRPARRPLPT